MTDEARIVSRSIELTWGGEQRVLPVLPMKPADDWRRLFAKKFPEHETTEMDTATAMSLTSTNVLDLLLNYDRTNVLGTKEWVRSNVTDEELADAFVEVYRRSFRLSRLPQELMRAMLAPPQPAKSPNGRSLTGTSTPTNSAPVSATNN